MVEDTEKSELRRRLEKGRQGGGGEEAGKGRQGGGGWEEEAMEEEAVVEELRRRLEIEGRQEWRSRGGGCGGGYREE